VLAANLESGAKFDALLLLLPVRKIAKQNKLAGEEEGVNESARMASIGIPARIEGRTGAYIMSTDARDDVHGFYLFMEKALRSTEPLPTPEELLEQWRASHSEDGDSEDVNAVYEALRDMAAGDSGTPLEEYERRVLGRHGLSNPQ